MVDYNKILAEFRPLVGFQRDYSLDIAGSLHTSMSGAYFQDAHPLITLNAMSSVAPMQDSVLIPVAAFQSYKKGEVVRFGGALYQAQVDTVFNGSDMTNWEKTNNLSIWLSLKRDESIKKVIQNVIQKSVIAKQGKEVLATVHTITTGETQEIESSGKYSILELWATRPSGLALMIQVYAPTYPVNIYNAKGELEATIANRYEQVILYQPTGGLNNKYLLVSKQPETGQIDTKQIGNDFNYFKVKGYISDTELPGQDKRETSSDTGMDLSVTTVCDFTGLLIKNKFDFVNLIKLQFAADMLKEFIYNPSARVNRTAMIASRADILYALDGDNSKFAKTSGLSLELRQAYEAFILNTQGYNSECLPCNRKGTRYRTIG